MESQKQKWIERLNHREAERKAKIEERKSTLGDHYEMYQSTFWNPFQALSDKVEANLKKNEETSSGVVSLEEIHVEIEQMLHILNQSIHFLSDYDKEQSQKRIQELEDRLQALRKQKAPPKFRFKGLKKKGPMATSKVKVEEESTSSGKEVDGFDVPNERRFQDLHHQVLKIQEQDIQLNSDLTFERLQNCLILIDAMTTALRFVHCQNIQVFAAPTNGSVWVEETSHTTLHVAARQLRYYQCQHIDSYIYTCSKPTIEQSQNMRFAPYGLSYEVIFQVCI